MILIPSLLVAIISLLSALVMLVKRQYDNAFTRFCVTVFYLVLTFLPVPIEVARELNRWFWILVLGVEVVWWAVAEIGKRWKK